jgi:sugar diacid utilization regulator
MRFYTEEAVEPDLTSILKQFKDKKDVKVDWIERIREADRRKGAELEKTLIAYVENGFDATAASEALFVHRNTFRARWEKIGLVTGMVLTPKNMLALYCSFKCKQVFQEAN